MGECRVAKLAGAIPININWVPIGGRDIVRERGDFKRYDVAAACHLAENENPQATRAINPQVSTAVFANPHSDKEKGNRWERKGELMDPLLQSAATVAVPYPSIHSVTLLMRGALNYPRKARCYMFVLGDRKCNASLCVRESTYQPREYIFPISHSCVIKLFASVYKQVLARQAPPTPTLKCAILTKVIQVWKKSVLIIY